ncbi:capon-like protein isoform X1 [Danaus plexippus]|uniref:capon-like protein isoform X1 n=1 Tax=Danaus plexippus TaxID=13037 RepID=UPI002AB0A0F2|nr:capon-like protein isoform X1 [Danaus plexippus]
MSNKDRDKHRRHDIKSLPTEVLLKARSTLVSLGGALKSKHNSPHSKQKQVAKEKLNRERLKSCRSEPEFSEMRKPKHRSRIDEPPRDYDSRVGLRSRPVSMGAMKRYENDLDFHSGNFPKDFTQFESIDDISRLMIPNMERINQEINMQEMSERPRKKLSFREPEIVGSATLGRSSKLMAVNNLSKRPNRLSLRTDAHSSLDGLDFDLENQAMKIVRTVGQAFEVCHKMQTNAPDNPVPSTSASDVVNEPAPKEPASECGASESVASTSKAADDPKAKLTRPKHLDLLPPAPKKDGKRVNQVQISIPSINLPDLPECVTKVDVSVPEGDAATPLSSQHQVKLLRERLEQQSQQTQAAVAQLLLLRDQLAAEQAARCEAQARTHQLLVHNKELLEHIAALVSHLQEKEKGNSRPISAQQLTLLPQTNSGSNDGKKTENINSCNGNYEQINTNALISLIAKNYNITQNVENNNINLSPLPGSSSATVKQDGSSSPINFENMTNEQIQGYLISKFQDMNVTNGSESKEFFQNSKAFPDIPPLKNFSNSDLEKLLSNHFYMGNTNPDSDLNALVQAMSLAESQNSLYSSSPTSSSNSSPDDISSDDGASFIMPLSHNGTLAATGNDGRIRLIVPVSPSESISKVDELEAKNDGNATAGMTLTVPGTSSTLAPPAPITRSTSEKVPNRSELMSALRAQWTRHTTK